MRRSCSPQMVPWGSQSCRRRARDNFMSMLFHLRPILRKCVFGFSGKAPSLDPALAAGQPKRSARAEVDIQLRVRRQSSGLGAAYGYMLVHGSFPLLAALL
jgi:hypothetical protein